MVGLLTKRDNLEYSYIGFNERIIKYVLGKMVHIEVKLNEMAENRLY
jgi:hypothetical protein